MIFEEIVLYNFGIYKGRHVIQLSPPSAKKAIILLGGLNGSGKTTLLDALQLTLYGKFSKHSKRGNNNYLDYLSRMINYQVDPKEGATLELQFKHFRNGKEESIRIQRSWRSTGKCIKETVEVKRDGILDAVITDRWYEYVEEFIPSRISSLFFFDGEKIEAFADQDKAAELLKTGIHALLGLDLVYRLSTDLLTVERKRKIQHQSQDNRLIITTLEDELKQIETNAAEIVQQTIEMQEHLEDLIKQQEKLQKNYRREGGELFEQREVIETQLTATKNEFSKIESQLREIAAGETPLLLVRDLLKSTDKQANIEKNAKNNQAFYDELEKRDTILIDLLKQHTVKRSALSAIETFLNTDKLERQHSFQIKTYLNIEPTAFTHLQDDSFTQRQASTQIILNQDEKLRTEINDCERQLAGIPDPDSLKGIQEKLLQIQDEIKNTSSKIQILEEEQNRTSNKIIRKEKELTLSYEKESTEQFATEITQQIIKQSEKVRQTLEKFGNSVTAKHISKLERLIYDSFQELIRKEDFITHIEIDPESYKLTLYTPCHEKLYPENLSAGERQLLAISILWGLSRATGRPLPAIIDTPLSRLDGKHRQNLVNNYFHQASHQVILLSTDEEINEKYHATLKPAIGREYCIAYDDKKQSSVFKSGYFF